MSVFATDEKVPENYIMALINSNFISKYVDDFVNNTQTFQINDARQLPIIIPTNEQIITICDLVAVAVEQKKSQIDFDWKAFQKQIDGIVTKLYNLN